MSELTEELEELVEKWRKCRTVPYSKRGSGIAFGMKECADDLEKVLENYE